MTLQTVKFMITNKISLKFEKTIAFYFIFVYNIKVADVAQLVEQLICNQQVVGSSPSISSS